MLDTPSVVAPRRLASGTLMMARGVVNPLPCFFQKLGGGFGQVCMVFSQKEKKIEI